jgi:hypothetical protein
MQDELKRDDCICYDRPIPISEKFLKMTDEEIEVEFKKRFGDVATNEITKK